MFFILIIGFLLAYTLQKWLIHRFWENGLDISLQFRDKYIYEGDSSVLKEVVTNAKRLPLPALEVRLAMSANLIFDGEAAGNSRISDKSYKRDVFSLLMRQQITRNLHFHAVKRGHYQITETDIKAYDFFYQGCGYKTLPQDTDIYVYPGQVDARKIRTVCTAISGSMLVQNRMFPDPFEFSGIREYVPTDPASRINWKATTRTGTPMVNQYDSTSNLDLDLVFDLEDSHIIKEDDLVEETIRIVSSLTAHLATNRMNVTVYGNPQIPGESSLFAESITHGSSQIAEFNRRLSCIEGTSMGTLELLTQIPKSSAQLVIFVSKNMERDVINALSSHASLAHPLLWVIPIHAADEPEIPEIPGVQVQLWTAEE